MCIDYNSITDRTKKTITYYINAQCYYFNKIPEKSNAIKYTPFFNKTVYTIVL